jgi:hypothetical protein
MVQIHRHTNTVVPLHKGGNANMFTLWIVQVRDSHAGSGLRTAGEYDDQR